jgi:GTP pyrophosphokinase
MVPLRTELVNGDTVEIITSPHHHPSRDWLQFVKTTKARSKIRQWLKVAEREQSVALGKELLERELRKSGTSLQKLLKNGDDLKKVVQEFSFVAIDDLLAAVGHGKLSPGQVSNRLFRTAAPAAEGEAPPELPVRRAKEEPAGLKIKDLDDLLVRLANCCQPIPGDAIMGYITRGKGVTIHRADCPYLASTESFRHIPAEWDGGGGPQKLYPVKIQVVTVDKPGLLADITSALKIADVNVTKASVETVNNKGIAHFTIQVADQVHLDKVFGALKRLKEVISVRRTTG